MAWLYASLFISVAVLIWALDVIAARVPAEVETSECSECGAPRGHWDGCPWI